MPVSDGAALISGTTRPNIHLCTVADFDAFLRGAAPARDEPRRARGRPAGGMLPNLLGELAIYRFRRT
jgi:hypothetical protein